MKRKLRRSTFYLVGKQLNPSDDEDDRRTPKDKDHSKEDNVEKSKDACRTRGSALYRHAWEI